MHFLHNAISDKPVQCYDLEVIISVGYRVKSLRGTQFRRWATQVLKDRIYGKNVNKRDIQLAFSRFQQQYPNDQLQLTQWNAAHDRFIVCDDALWLCGSSVKDAGRRTSMLIKLETSPDLILSTLPTTP